MSDDTRLALLAKLFVHLIGHATCTGYVVALTNGEVRSITCLFCGVTSFSPEDIDRKFCAQCARFHEDPR